MLELKSISFTVSSAAEQAEKGILDDVSLTVGDNQFVVITGPNGGGKSTLAKIIMGIERPTAGRILFDGQDITRTVGHPARRAGHRLRLSAAGALQGPDGQRPGGPCRPQRAGPGRAVPISD